MKHKTLTNEVHTPFVRILALIEMTLTIKLNRSTKSIFLTCHYLCIHVTSLAYVTNNISYFNTNNADYILKEQKAMKIPNFVQILI